MSTYKAIIGKNAAVVAPQVGRKCIGTTLINDVAMLSVEIGGASINLATSKYDIAIESCQIYRAATCDSTQIQHFTIVSAISNGGRADYAVIFDDVTIGGYQVGCIGVDLAVIKPHIAIAGK